MMKRSYVYDQTNSRPITEKSERFNLLSGIKTIEEELTVERSLILFVLEGKIVLNHNEFKNRVVSKGEMCLLLKDSVFQGEVLESETMLMSFAFKPHFYFNKDFSLENLPDLLPANYKYDFELLPIHERIFDFLTLVSQSIVDQMESPFYYEIAEQQLFIYLRHYYSEVELLTFFYPFMGGDVSFKFFVFNHLNEFRSVEELAALANMSLSTFTRRFKSVFNEAPYKWLTKRKTERIYRDLRVSPKSYVEIADEYDFSSQAYFTTFCKKHFGKTPQEIRQEVGRY